MNGNRQESALEPVKVYLNVLATRNLSSSPHTGSVINVVLSAPPSQSEQVVDFMLPDVPTEASGSDQADQTDQADQASSSDTGFDDLERRFAALKKK